MNRRDKEWKEKIILESSDRTPDPSGRNNSSRIPFLMDDLYIL